MNKNNFFMVFAIVTLLGINFEMHSSERSSLGSRKTTLDMSFFYEEALAQVYYDGSETISRENNSSQLYRNARVLKVQIRERKITKNTLQSHIIDDYVREYRK